MGLPLLRLTETYEAHCACGQQANSGRWRKLGAWGAEMRARNIGGGRYEINNDFSVFIGVANAFAFEIIVFIAMFVAWYGAESHYAAALAN